MERFGSDFLKVIFPLNREKCWLMSESDQSQTANERTDFSSLPSVTLQSDAWVTL